MKYLKIDNKEVMPIINFGISQIKDLKECETVIRLALYAGYRGIDTADVYGNEESVGEALSKTTLKRTEIFLTTKVWVSNFTYKDAIASVNRSLMRMKTDYIDLVLIHQPFGNYYEAYRALEDLQDQGIIKYIGVSNFYPDRLVDLCLYARKWHQVNQIEINPYFQRQEDILWNKKYSVFPQAWAPFARGKAEIFAEPTLKSIASKYKKTPPQVILRWLVQLEIPFAVKSANLERIKENIDIFDFKLSTSDIDLISKLDLHKSSFVPQNIPEAAERAYGWFPNIKK